jgi:adenylylsulfate kinase
VSYKLFIGRWMPLHEGHVYIMRSFLNNGHKVCVAIRDTPVSVKNPFSMELRRALIEEEFSEEIGSGSLRIIDLPDIDQVVEGRGVGYALVEAPEEIQRISGTEIRENALVKFNGGRGRIIWMTGLPCAGKTTLLRGAAERLRRDGVMVETLDGDEFRHVYMKDRMGFGKTDRGKNIHNAAEVATKLATMGIVVLCAFVSPYRQFRGSARFTAGQERVPFYEVYVRAEAATCAKRDVKGMWAKAKAGEIKHFTGYDDPYEVPVNPDWVVDTEKLSIEEGVERIVHLATRG